MPMEYAKTVPFIGHGARALDVARSAFVGQGFQIVASSDYELQVTGPGMNSTKENPLRGVSEASIIVRSASIEIKAILGGVRKMKTFLYLFPLGLALFFLMVFGVLALSVPGLRHPWTFLGPALALSPWVFLAPLMGRSIEKKTTQAVDTLLGNMVIMGRDG
jgi:hypothetical protein